MKAILLDASSAILLAKAGFHEEFAASYHIITGIPGLHRHHCRLSVTFSPLLTQPGPTDHTGTMGEES